MPTRQHTAKSALGGEVTLLANEGHGKQTGVNGGKDQTLNQAVENRNAVEKTQRNQKPFL